MTKSQEKTNVEVFIENVEDLHFTCKEYLDGRIPQDVLLTMIEVCKGKLEGSRSGGR